MPAQPALDPSTLAPERQARRRAPAVVAAKPAATGQGHTAKAPATPAVPAKPGQFSAPDFGIAFALAPVGMVISRHRVMVDCNEAACEIFGYSRELMVGQSFMLLYPTHVEFERQGERMLSALHARGRWSDQRVMRRATGESFWCRVTGRALERNDPHAAGIWCFEDLGSRQAVKSELTSREREVAARLLDGMTSKEIGRVLAISHRTVEIHRARLMRKYGASTSAELVQKLLLG